MSNISQKLTYLNETKSQLKDMINYGLPSEQQITNSTTFRNYVSSIFNAFLEALRTPDTLFTNLPKKSGSGSNITLNDTANAPMIIELGATELTQAGTPTPSSPQAVHTISGSNKVVVNGKNLIPYQDKNFTINGVNFKTINGNLILNGTATFNITGDMLVNDNYLKVDVEHTTYYLTRTNVNSNLTINLMGENSTLVAQLPRNSSDLSTTVSISSSNKVYLGFFIPQGATFNNYDGGIMVSKAGGTYEPYISQEAEVDLGNIEYCKIGNYEDKFIRTSGRNSIPFTNQDFTLNSVRYYVQDGSLILNGTSTSETSSKNTNFKNNFSFTLEAGTYTISHKTGVVGAHLYNYDNDSSSIITLATNIASATFTLNEETKVYIGFYVYQNNFSNINTELMISKVGGDYEPYGSKKWYIKKNIGKVVLDGSETIGTEGTVAGKTRFRIGGISNVYKNSSSSDASTIKCDKLISGSVVDTYNDIQCISFGLSSSDYYKDFVVYITDTGTMSTADFITWLGTNNLTVYYRLATPTYTQITGTLANQLENVYQKLLSYSGTTNISQINNDLGFVMSVSAIEEL